MIEYFLYAVQPEPPSIESIQNTAAIAGWNIRVARDWKNWGNYAIVERGHLQNDDVTVGWRFRWPDNVIDDGTPPSPIDVEDAISNRKRERIESLIRCFEIGAATWTIDRPFVIRSHLEFSSINDARRQMGIEYANHIKKTKCKYTVLYCEHSAFQRLIMACVATLTNGMLEDPMSAMYAFPPQDPQKLASLVSKTLHSW